MTLGINVTSFVTSEQIYVHKCRNKLKQNLLKILLRRVINIYHNFESISDAQVYAELF